MAAVMKPAVTTAQSRTKTNSLDSEKSSDTTSAWTANHDALKRAIKSCQGGFKVLAQRSGVAEEHIAEVEAGDELLDSSFCPDIERACGGKVTCEELRGDLIWHRDGAGHVMGYSCPIDTPRQTLLNALHCAKAQEPSPLVDGKWDPMAYRAGMLYGVSDEECHDLMEVYGKARDWTNATVLESFAADIDAWKSDGAHYQCYGMLWDLDEKTRESLLKEAGAMYMRDWDDTKSAALWEKAQAIRASEPFKSSSAKRAYLAGMASIVGVHGDGADLVDFFTAKDRVELGDAEDMARATEYALGLILDAALKPAREDAASWGNLVAGSTRQVYGQIGTHTAERIGRTAANLLDLMLPGLEAIHDYQFVVMTNGNDDCLDAKSRVSLCGFQMIMQQLTQQLVVLRENALTRQKELQA